MKPVVLVAATSHWFPSARLAMALAEAGCLVEAVCPPRHPLCITRAVRQTHTYHGLAPVTSLASAIRTAKPDLIIPGDDLATRQLHHLYRREISRGQPGAQVCALIERSFGAPESFSIVYERASFMRAAEQEGVRVPKCSPIANVKELRRWTSQVGFPIVLKADGTSGGDGVRVARTTQEAEKAFRTLHAPPLFLRAAKRALINGDKTLVWPSILRRRYAVSAQTFVDGHEATSMAACWKGTVLAGLHFEVIKTRYAAGPATVMRLVDNVEMATAVEKMVHRLNLSGLHGFDFMLEARTSNAYLIEINPRITQVGHLAFGPGRDLASALVAALTGSAVQVRTQIGNETVALFPQEWIRDAASDFLRLGYHDVPWEEPELVAACIRRAQKQRSLKVPGRQGERPPAVVAPQRPRPVTKLAAALHSEFSECRHE